jgi:two-component system, OmpR family, response regulator
MAATLPLILIVEDDADVCTMLCTFLEDMQRRVAIANELSSGADILEKLNPDLLIVDIMLQGGNGNDLARLAYAKSIPVLLMSGEPQSIERLQEENAPFLQKPFRLSELEQWVKNLVPTHDDEPPAAS